MRSASVVSVDGSISACLMDTVCFGNKYHKTLSCRVKTNDDYLLSISAKSQTSVTFYDAYLWSTVSPLKFRWQNFPVSYWALQRVVKGSRWLRKWSGSGFRHSEKCTCLGIYSTIRGLFTVQRCLGIITSWDIFKDFVYFWVASLVTFTYSHRLSHFLFHPLWNFVYSRYFSSGCKGEHFHLGLMYLSHIHTQKHSTLSDLTFIIVNLIKLQHQPQIQNDLFGIFS